MGPSAQPFLWKRVLFAWEWKIICISKAEHLTSFWYRGPGELGNGLLKSQAKVSRRTAKVVRTDLANSRHFATPPLVSSRNDVWETSAEIPYLWRVITQICNHENRRPNEKQIITIFSCPSSSYYRFVTCSSSFPSTTAAVSICYQAPRFQSAVARVKPITIMTLFVSVQRKWYINQKCDHQDVPVRFTGRHWAMAVGSNRVLGRVVNFVPVVMPTSAAKAYYIQTKFGAWSTDRATEPKSYGRGGSYIKSLSYIKYFVTIIDLPGWKKKYGVVFFFTKKRLRLAFVTRDV